MAGLAQAFFGRGIPNFIGAGWQVDDACAEECARWFYARLMGLRSPTASDGVVGTAPPATIGEALKQARNMALARKQRSSSWGAYQHYGHVSDKLVAIANVAAIDATEAATTAAAPTIRGARRPRTFLPTAGEAQIANNRKTPRLRAADREPRLRQWHRLQYRNICLRAEIDRRSRQASVSASRRRLVRETAWRQSPFVRAAVRCDFGTSSNESGWGIIFHEQTPQDIRDALQPLIDASQDAGATNATRSSTTRRTSRCATGTSDAEYRRATSIRRSFPYYLLLIGPPNLDPVRVPVSARRRLAGGRPPAVR